ncbi:large ribosomal subunit protein P1-like [Ochotona princeps]|uniref:large ribosomal subunit protein P1-like n=1 Tax=Ochotona princeps TaxID=9978 RepID=UPI002714B2ED|nr:large ribosomal subunit protein P1-like [Ochotona princeps]
MPAFQKLTLCSYDRNTNSIFPALVLHDKEEVTVTAYKTNAFIKAAGVNVEPFWPGSFAKAVAKINVRPVDPLPQQVLPPTGGHVPTTAASAAEEKKVEVKKEESEESDDNMGFGLFY